MSEFKKHDEGKAQLSFLPLGPLSKIAEVLEFGAKKYSRSNWRKGCNHNRYMDAALRHLLAHNEGEDLDPESGLTHLAHAGCCILFLIELQKTHPELDYRENSLE